MSAVEILGGLQPGASRSIPPVGRNVTAWLPPCFRVSVRASALGSAASAAADPRAPHAFPHAVLTGNSRAYKPKPVGLGFDAPGIFALVYISRSTLGGFFGGRIRNRANARFLSCLECHALCIKFTEARMHLPRCGKCIPGSPTHVTFFFP